MKWNEDLFAAAAFIYSGENPLSRVCIYNLLSMKKKKKMNVRVCVCIRIHENVYRESKRISGDPMHNKNGATG